jgi:PKD repeat protein
MTRTIGVKEIWPPKAVVKPESYPTQPGENELEIFFDARYSSDRDGGTITNYHWDFDDGTTADQKYLYHTFPAPDTIYEVTLTVTDNDGASESIKSIVKIDQNVPPVTEISHQFGSNDETQWYAGTERISFTATDWTKVISTYFRIDGGEWERYISEEQPYYPVGTEGMHIVEAYSVDYYHNEEVPVSDIFGVDKTKPTLNMNIQGDINDDWYITPVTITLSANDELSGLKNIYYKIDLGQWVEYTSPFIIDNSGGSVYLSYIAEDNAGNTEQKSETINFEPPPTTPTITGYQKGSTGIEYEYTFSSRDIYPEDDQLYYFVDWGDGTDSGWQGPFETNEYFTLSHSWSEDRTYFIKAKAKDSYGAESDWASLPVTMPRTKNFITILIEDILELFPNFTIILKYFFNTFS